MAVRFGLCSFFWAGQAGHETDFEHTGWVSSPKAIGCMQSCSGSTTIPARSIVEPPNEERNAVVDGF